MSKKFNEIFNKIINVPKINLINCQWECDRDVVEQCFNYNPMILYQLMVENNDQINLPLSSFNGQLINAFILTNQQQKILTKLLDKISYFNKQTLVQYWGNMLSQTLTMSELKTTTQNILNGFQRMYQQQYIVNDKPKYRKFRDSLQKRKQWLKNILAQINDEYFFTTETGIEVLEQFFGSNYKKLYSNWLEQKRFKDSVLIMQYLGIRNCVKDINIDERLNKHFQTFKFRDN